MTTKEVAIPQMCIYLRNGIEIWVETNKVKKLGEDWRNGLKAAVEINGRYINTVDIVGIFLPEDLEDMKRRKQGQWRCKKGNWHSKEEISCSCTREKEWDDRGFYKI